jgi:transcriptional regulator with XRE-family HTH domain
VPEPPDTRAASLQERDIARAIATRVRTERKRLGMTLHDVAERTGLSLGMISKIENAQTNASLRTLSQLSTALEVPVTAFFRGLEEERDASFVKHGEGLELVRQGTRHGHRYTLLAIPGRHSTRFEPFLVTLSESSEAFPLFQHEGTEFIHVLEGRVRYGHGRHGYDMEPGDSLLFDGTTPHGPEQLVALPIRFLSIIVRPGGTEERG